MQQYYCHPSLVIRVFFITKWCLKKSHGSCAGEPDAPGLSRTEALLSNGQEPNPDVGPRQVTQYWIQHVGIRTFVILGIDQVVDYFALLSFLSMLLLHIPFCLSTSSSVGWQSE